MLFLIEFYYIFYSFTEKKNLRKTKIFCTRKLKLYITQALYQIIRWLHNDTDSSDFSLITSSVKSTKKLLYTE